MEAQQVETRPGDHAPGFPVGWTRDLLEQLGWPDARGMTDRIAIHSDDPVLPTRFRVGEASAAAITACGAAAAELATLRGVDFQTVATDVRCAAASLLSFALQRVAGLDLMRDANRPTIALYRDRHGEWIHLHGGFPHLRDGTLDLLRCADEAGAIARAVAGWSASDLEDALAERGLCGARLRSRAEWLAHPQGAALASAPLVEVQRIGDAPPQPLPPLRSGRSRPLEGLRILDLTRVLAGPTCARTLAEHGADVLHVRSPHLPSIEAFVVDTNPGKRSCFLDLDTAEDRQRLAVLAPEADVLCQGYRPGALARRGFSPEELATLRPGIVVVSVDCYGHVGPWRERAGWEQLAQTVTGMALEHGGSNSASIVPAAVTDYTTGNLAALGAQSALERRAREGGSWHVRVSLARTAMWIGSLPRCDEGAAPSGLDPAFLAEQQIEMESAWGRLTRLAPVVRMSGTPARWDRPPAPLGSDPASWLAADGSA